MGVATFLNGRAPDRLRGIDMLALSETGYLRAGTFISDQGGGGTATWVVIGTTPCRIDPLSSGTDEAIVAERLDDRSTHKITVPPDLAVTTDHRFEVSGVGEFEVTAVRIQTAERTKVFEVVPAS